MSKLYKVVYLILDFHSNIRNKKKGAILEMYKDFFSK